MADDPILERCKALRTEKRFQAAFAEAQHATSMNPTSANAWWQVGLNALSINDLPNALAGFRETVRLAPRFATGWAEYANALSQSGKIDEAEKAYLQAIRIEPAESSHLRSLATLCEGKKDIEGHLRILLKIDAIGKATAYELNKIGILFHDKKNFGEAIQYYRRSASLGTDTSGLFNLGLAYNDSEVSQDVDAVDAWRRVLKIKPDFARATERLGTVTPRLKKLAGEAVANHQTLLAREEWFEHYLSPFELLGVGRESTFDELTAKVIQRQKKLLLQEIALESGRVSWLDGAIIDQSRAIGLCDELSDEQKRQFHWNVFSNENLLRFLTRGEHRHFLYDSEYSPLETLEALDDQPEFAHWLSERFAPQYNLVLSKAIERRSLPIIEALFDGRRWVIPSDDDPCFEGAFRHTERLLAPLSALASAVDYSPPRLSDVQAVLHNDNFSKIFNLLPIHFRVAQSRAVQLVRNIAISCHNKHGDSDLSKAVLQLSKEFIFKSADLTHQLKEDFEKIEALVREQRKHEAKLTSGNVAWEVTKDGVRQGQCFIAAKDVTTIRWGILVSGYQGAPVYEFIMAFRDTANTEVVFSWKASADLEKQEKLFNNLVQAALTYIAPSILEKVTARLDSGQEVNIGTCKLRKEGVIFSTQGWLFAKTNVVPWPQVGSNLERGQLVICDRRAPRTRTIMPLRDTENAVVLHFLSNTRD